jgi:GntR family transcriptional regulator / MocR family aminotransferase
VAYIGSASKRLVPGMRLGWMLTPSWLGWPLISVKAIEDRGSEAIGQLALHDFIERGELDRHLRRMRLRYQRRRQALMDSLDRHLPQVRVEEGAAGLYELAELPQGVDEAALISAAAGRGLGVEGLALHRFKPAGPPGLVLGFAALPEPAIEQSIRLLAAAFVEVARQP